MRRARSDHHTSIVTCLLVVAISTVTGCARRGTYLEQPIGETHTTSSSTGGARPQGVDEPRATIGVVVTDDLRAACGLPRHQQAPRFSFEGARLRPNGDDELAGVVRCLASDRLGDASLVIVGYADPRGEDDYSEKLGLHRADAARQYLVDRGIAHERIAIRSEGSRDAKGTSEPSWALDRRVELRLAEARSQAGMPVPKFDGAGTAQQGEGAASQAQRATQPGMAPAPQPAQQGAAPPAVVQTIPPAPAVVPPSTSVNPPGSVAPGSTAPSTPPPPTPSPPGSGSPVSPTPPPGGAPAPSVAPPGLPPGAGGPTPPTR